MLSSLTQLCFAGLLGGAPAVKIDEKFLADPKAPPLNQAVLRFAKEHLGKKIGDGECATLGFEAFRAAKLKLPDTAEDPWGDLVIELKPAVKSTDKILPGDILQMKDVHMEGTGAKFGGFFAIAPQHTAIVSEVEPGLLHVIHQNWGKKEEARTVSGFPFVVEYIRKGTIRVYRPR